MGIDSYKFVSPGVFVDEIDNSQRTKQPARMGPVVIGRTERGPGMEPVLCNSFSDFVEIFGNPSPGGVRGDVWRDGNRLSPTYAAYAAQAWLRNSNPVTVVRVLGTESSNPSSEGLAGWSRGKLTADAADGGAYGLFLADSSSLETHEFYHAATIYAEDETRLGLIGTQFGTEDVVSSSACIVESSAGSKGFELGITGSGVDSRSMKFNFDTDSSNYIRKVLNTNPTLTNSTVQPTTTLQKYWLGETFDRSLDDNLVSSSAGDTLGVLLALQSGSDFNMASQNRSAVPPQTGDIIGQNLNSTSSWSPTLAPSLFKFKGLSIGEWSQRNLKISISDIKYSAYPDVNPFGSFTVEVRSLQDVDSAPEVYEKFSNCNLNPSSEDYIAKRIGNKYKVWDDGERVYRTYGDYDNKSKFVYVHMYDILDDALLPFGFYGPTKYKTSTITSGSNDFSPVTIVEGSGSVPLDGSITWNGDEVAGLPANNTASFNFPTVPFNTNSTEVSSTGPKGVYWGVDTHKSSGNTRYEPSFAELLRPKSSGISSFSGTDYTQHSEIFTLDNLEWMDSSSIHAQYDSGSHTAGTSITAGQYWENNESESQDASYQHVIDAGFNKFSLPLFGGTDGFDITEVEPLRNSALQAGDTENSSYIFNSIKRAIDCVADPEVVECNMVTMPGITYAPFNHHLVRTCENRGDALAVIDVDGGYEPTSEGTSEVRGTVSATVEHVRDEGFNSSYACTYYPWVQISDTVVGGTLWCPPSVVALGTIASSEKKSKLWFAPAGFTRGGLTEGSAGLPVIGVRDRLTSEDRDKLYDAQINPIATFPAEGIVIFGQKTLQLTPSALDRINVRRLMIYVKKEISRMAATLLFDQNVQETWNRFIGKAVPFLEEIKTGLGITDFRFVLDETTTTPDLIDQNIMYAKVIIKPARAIEFIAIDFSITNSGASFAD